MAALQEPRHQTVQAIYRLYEQREALQEPRGYLGASVLGHACARYLWLHFRWARRERFDGRLLRLFEAGRQFEPRAIEELRAIGCEVHAGDEAGRQIGVSELGGHLRGHLDAMARGLPEAPNTLHVVEFKTHSAKSFAELLAKGVRAAKPMHVAQMQIYMGLTGLTRALYLAENKDTSALYSERVEFDMVEFKLLMARARATIEAAEPPARLSQDPAWYQCKWCHFHPLCHGTAAPAANCRTCAHSTPEPDGDARWSCAQHKRDLTTAEQRVGCGSHRYIPILLERVAGAQVGVIDEPDDNATVRYEGLANGATPGALSSVAIEEAYA